MKVPNMKKQKPSSSPLLHIYLGESFRTTSVTLKVQKNIWRIVKSQTWVSSGPGCPRKQRLEASTSPPAKICVCPSNFALTPPLCPPRIWFKQQNKQLMMRTPRYFSKYPNIIPGKYFRNIWTTSFLRKP